MGTLAAHFQSYMDFATVNGTVQDGGTWVLLAGPVLIALLGLYAAWNVAAAIVNGVNGTVRIAKRLVTRPAVVAAPVTATAATVTIARSAPVRMARSAA
jgi:hypothetical protein